MVKALGVLFLNPPVILFQKRFLYVLIIRFLGLMIFKNVFLFLLFVGLLRCGKSCRLRWINYLRPDLKRGNFTDGEDQIIVKLHSIFGNK